jgi:hypothetical protein
MGLFPAANAAVVVAVQTEKTRKTNMIEVKYEPVPLPPRTNPNAGRPPADETVALLNCPVGMSFFWPGEIPSKKAASYVRSAKGRMPKASFKYRLVVEKDVNGNDVAGVRYKREA